jgi:hypothetical protein
VFNRCLREKNGARIFTNLGMKLWYGHGLLSMSHEAVTKKAKQYLSEMYNVAVPEYAISFRS